jgi:hypothetical protein
MCAILGAGDRSTRILGDCGATLKEPGPHSALSFRANPLHRPLMKKRTLENIISDVAKSGTAQSDWAFLLRNHFWQGSVNEFKEWARSENLTWDTTEYDRGGFEKGYTIVFSRGPGWVPPVLPRARLTSFAKTER